MDLALFIAQGAPAAQSCANAAFMPLMIIMIFYFLLWRPQQKQLADARRFRDGLKDGDKVVTTGGLFGRIVRVEDSVVELELAPKVKIRIDRSQILKLQPGEAADES